MHPISLQQSLQPYHTFGVHVLAKAFTAIYSVEDFVRLDIENYPTILILGGGSNILFTQDFPGLVIRNQIQGISVQDLGDQVSVTAGAGVNWDYLVAYCVEQGWGGLENLSLIPGTVGASPIQNIGAYGVEMCQSFAELTAIHLKTKKIQKFTQADCAFGYRNSIFKQEQKNQYCIINVTFLLSKTPVLKLDYGIIRQELEKNNITQPSILDVRTVVCSIRKAKLPDPQVIGNAGSFFKNPEIDIEYAQVLQKTYPNIPIYPLNSGKVKIAAGWLIEQTGWKGKTLGHAGCHAQQALVLTNADGQAKGFEILTLAKKIQESVWNTFGIAIETEVNIL